MLKMENYAIIYIIIITNNREEGASHCGRLLEAQAGFRFLASTQKLFKSVIKIYTI